MPHPALHALCLGVLCAITSCSSPLLTESLSDASSHLQGSISDERYLLRLAPSEGSPEAPGYRFEVCFLQDSASCTGAFRDEDGEDIRFNLRNLLREGASSEETHITAEDLRHHKNTLHSWAAYRRALNHLSAASTAVMAASGSMVISLNARDLLRQGAAQKARSRQLLQDLKLPHTAPKPIHFGSETERIHVFSDEVMRFFEEEFSFSVQRYLRSPSTEIEKTGTTFNVMLERFVKAHPGEALQRAIAEQYWQQYLNYTIARHSWKGSLKQLEDFITAYPEHLYRDIMGFKKQQGISRRITSLLHFSRAHPLSFLKTKKLFALTQPGSKVLLVAAGVTAVASALSSLGPSPAQQHPDAGIQLHALYLLAAPLSPPGHATAVPVPSIPLALQDLGTYLKALQGSTRENTIMQYCYPAAQETLCRELP